MTTDPQRRQVRVSSSCTREQVQEIREALGVLDQVGDYLLCRNAAGVAGWVPESCVEDTVEGP